MRLLTLLVGLSFAACGNPDQRTCSSTAYRAGYLDAGTWTETRQSGCSVTSRCGRFVFIDCGQAVDGPAYYVDEPAACVLEVCGGACMGPTSTSCVACPPPEWSCGT